MEAVTVIIAVLFGIIILSLVYKLILPGLDAEKISPQESRLIFIFGGCLYLLIPYYYSIKRGYDVKSLFRFNRVPPATLLISVLYGLALMIIGDEIDRLVELIKPYPEWMKEMILPLQADTGLEWILVITGAVIIASVCEESLFRGFFQVTLEKQGDITRAVLLSAVTWTIIHFNFYWAAQIFFIGVFIGFIAWRTDSIIPAILVHGINNLLAVLLINAEDNFESGWYEWQGHVSPFVLMMALCVLVWSIHQLNIIHRRS